jgi:hypothetical protein
VGTRGLALGCGDSQGVLHVEVATVEIDGKSSPASNESPKPPRTVLRRSRSFVLSVPVPDPRATLQASSRDAAGGGHLVGLAGPERCPRTAPRAAFHDSSSASLNSSSDGLGSTFSFVGLEGPVVAW